MTLRNLETTGIVGVATLMVLCPWVYRLPVERDLGNAARTALEREGLGHWRVSFSGLSATLRGPASEQEEARRIVAQVPGVARVSVEAEPDAPAPAPSPQPGPNTLFPGRTTGLVQVLRHGERVYVRGLYPDREKAQQVVQAVQRAFAPLSVVDETALDRSIAALGWPAELERVLPLLAGVQELELAAGGDVLVLSGVVSSADQRETLGTRVQGFLPLGVAVENRLHAAGTAPPLHLPAPTGPPSPEARKAQAELDRVAATGEVSFLTASSRLSPGAYVYLDRIARQLQRTASPVLIGGHTDASGDPETNRTLSQKRADTVRVFLIMRGIRAHRLLAKGYGSAVPIAPNDTELGRRRNRRITFRIR